MRILFVQDTDWIRKNPIQHNHLLERMVKRGHEVRVIDFELLWRSEGKKELLSHRQVFRVSRMLKDAFHQVIRPSILKIPLFDYLSMFLTYPSEIARQLREFQPDVVMGDGLLTPFFAFRQAKKQGIKTVYYCIDLDYRLMPNKMLQGLGKIFESYNIRQADLVLSINEGLREYTIRMGANPEKTKVIRAGIDPALFNPNVSGGKIRKKYGIRKNDTLLFFVGWLYHFSGLKEVAEQLAHLNNDAVKLLIVGDGDAFADLERLREEYGLQNQMFLAGRQPYECLPEFLAAADICLLPAYQNEIMRDIVPIKTYEYMVMHNPVICTKLPGIIKEFGENNGVLYIDSPLNVLPKVIKLIRDTSIILEGRKARKFVEGNDWEKITDSFENTLKQLIL